MCSWSVEAVLASEAVLGAVLEAVCGIVVV